MEPRQSAIPVRKFLPMPSGNCVHLFRVFRFQNFNLTNRLVIIGFKKVKMLKWKANLHLNECPRFSQNSSEISRRQVFSYSNTEIFSEKIDYEEGKNINNE